MSIKKHAGLTNISSQWCQLLIFDWAVANYQMYNGAKMSRIVCIWKFWSSGHWMLFQRTQSLYKTNKINNLRRDGAIVVYLTVNTRSFHIPAWRNSELRRLCHTKCDHKSSTSIWRNWRCTIVAELQTVLQTMWWQIIDSWWEDCIYIVHSQAV